MTSELTDIGPDIDDKIDREIAKKPGYETIDCTTRMIAAHIQIKSAQQCLRNTKERFRLS